MNFESKINDYKKQLLSDIENFAKTGNTGKLILYSPKVRELEELQLQFNQLKDRFDRITRSNVNNRVFNEHESKEILSPRKKGKLLREKFIKLLGEKGFNVIHKKNVLYEINEKLSGVAYASERNSNRWFLGLPPENYKIIVLICEKETGEIFSMILNKEIIDKTIKYLGKDKNGQIKFNIAFKYGEYHLIVPTLGNIKISKNLDNYKLI